MDAHRLESLPLFEHLSRKDRSRVARWADEVEVAEGAELVTEGTFAHEFFIVEDGMAEVTRHGRRVAELGPGDFFGEIALLVSDHHRTATVTALSPMRLVVMFQTEFATMAEEMPEVAATLRETLRRRLRENAEP